MSEDNYSAKEENDMSHGENEISEINYIPVTFRYPGGYLSIAKYRYRLNHYYEANRSTAKSSVGCIITGKVELKSRLVNISLGAGDVFYIPSNEKYSSSWTGTPDIEFYGMHLAPGRSTPCRRQAGSGSEADASGGSRRAGRFHGDLPAREEWRSRKRSSRGRDVL